MRQFDIAARDTTIGSALGGLIYLTLPPGLALGTLQVQVLGAVVAPVYSAAAPLTPAAWAAALSASHAPWGELGSKKVIIASPRASLATVANPAAVAAHWDRVADSHAWLAGIPSARAYPIRIQHDVQISAGYMNAVSARGSGVPEAAGPAPFPAGPHMPSEPPSQP